MTNTPESMHGKIMELGFAPIRIYGLGDRGKVVRAGLIQGGPLFREGGNGVNYLGRSSIGGEWGFFIQKNSLDQSHVETPGRVVKLNLVHQDGSIQLPVYGREYGVLTDLLEANKEPNWDSYSRNVIMDRIADDIKLRRR